MNFFSSISSFSSFLLVFLIFFDIKQKATFVLIYTLFPILFPISPTKIPKNKFEEKKKGFCYTRFFFFWNGGEEDELQEDPNERFFQVCKGFE